MRWKAALDLARDRLYQRKIIVHDQILLCPIQWLCAHDYLPCPVLMQPACQNIRTRKLLRIKTNATLLFSTLVQNPEYGRLQAGHERNLTLNVSITWEQWGTSL